MPNERTGSRPPTAWKRNLLDKAFKAFVRQYPEWFCEMLSVPCGWIANVFDQMPRRMR